MPPAPAAPLMAAITGLLSCSRLGPIGPGGLAPSASKASVSASASGVTPPACRRPPGSGFPAPRKLPAPAGFQTPAGPKMPARAMQDGHIGRVVLLERQECGVQRLCGGGVDGVASIGAVQCHQSDTMAGLYQYCHERLLRSSGGAEVARKPCCAQQAPCAGTLRVSPECGTGPARAPLFMQSSRFVKTSWRARE